MRSSQKLATRAPLADVIDDLGIENQLRAIEAPTKSRWCSARSNRRCILIADGHHRYETALNFRELAALPTAIRASFAPTTTR